MRLVTTLSLVTLLAAASARAQHEGCPMHAQHMADAGRKSGVDARGDDVMGFDHAKTAHHFTLTKDGGAIQVTANDGQDAASVSAIRKHLVHVAESFAAGDFSMPHAIHATVVPGVSTLAAAKDAVSYAYEPLENGGRVVVRTSKPEALKAVHDFLAFQIDDHRTGDSKDVR
jgi:hypothetical protein